MRQTQQEIALKDRHIREPLLALFQKEKKREDGYLVVEELGLCQGNARVDIAVINGHIHGYEIKSEKDDLSRLPGQMDIYCKTLDAVTVVTTQKHLDQLQQVIPAWWGITLASETDTGVSLQELKASQQNPSPDATSLVQLLWRDEALLALKKLGLEKGMISKPREAIWNRLTSALTLEELRAVVLETLKQRQYWRADSQQK
jgi:hypothetical protein